MQINQYPQITNISDGDFLLVQTATDGAYKGILASDLKAYFGSSNNGNAGSTSSDTYYSDVSLLLPFNGTILDIKGHTIQSIGSPSIVTTQSVYGGSSLNLDGNSYLQITKDTSLTFASNAFTWEGFIYVPNPASANYMTICGNAVGGAAGDAGIFLSINAGHLVLRHWINGSSNAVSSNTVSANAWHHVAGVSVGGITNVFLDGIGGSPGSIEQPISDYDFYVGTVPGNAGYATNFVGNLNWLRITNGAARYTANFTIPTLPY